MGLKRLQCLLLCAAALTVSGVFFGGDESGDVYSWSREKLPMILDARTEVLSKPLFGGQEEDEELGGSKPLCGIECQSGLPPVDPSEQERILGYETMYENGTRTRTEITLLGFNKTSTSKASVAPSRRKRQIYGADGRFVISDLQFVTNYPFSTAVRLSTGCSGVLVSPKHVLTAAHCVHDGRDYLEGSRRMRVGVLQVKTDRRRLGRRRGFRQRPGRKGEGENSIDGDEVRGRKRVRVFRRRKEDDKLATEDGNTVEGKLKTSGHGRARRSAESKKQTVFRWSPVKQIYVPQGWIQPSGQANAVASDYDYALLKLRRPVRKKHMELGVAPSAAPLARIHFSGYDADKSLLDGRGGEKVIYRFCSVAKESDDLMYQHCDTQPGATGAGVYVRLRQNAADAGGLGRWQRRVIGVYSGHQWVEVEGGEKREFNVAVRITPAKYAQICHWIHGDPSRCKEI